MDRHIEIAGYLNVAWGVLILLAAFIVLLFVGGAGILSGDIQAFAITLGVSGAIGTLLLVIGTPSIIGGLGLVKRRSWARPLIIVMSVIHLFSFPFGTALSVYSLWVVTQDEARAQFA